MSAFKTVIFLKGKEIGGMGCDKHDLEFWHYLTVIPAFFILFG